MPFGDLKKAVSDAKSLYDEPYKNDKKQGAFLASNGPSNVSITFNNSSGTTLITAVRVDVE